MKIELGKTQQLIWKRTTEHGAYLGPDDSREEVLLPKKYLNQGYKKGDTLEVFIYKDSEDRLVATTQKAKLELGGLALARPVRNEVLSQRWIRNGFEAIPYKSSGKAAGQATVRRLSFCVEAKTCADKAFFDSSQRYGWGILRK